MDAFGNFGRSKRIRSIIHEFTKPLVLSRFASIHYPLTRVVQPL